MFQSSSEFEQVMFVQRVIDLLVSRPDKMDQDAVLTALTNWNGPPLPLYIFPPHLVQNGWQVQCSRRARPFIIMLIVFAVLCSQGSPASNCSTMLHLNALIQVGAAAGELPIIVHNNWADGDKGTHVQKVYVQL